MSTHEELYNGVTNSHLRECSREIMKKSIQKATFHNDVKYWVKVDELEVPYKLLVRTAKKFATGKELDDSFRSSEYNRTEFERRFLFPIIKYDQGINFFNEDEIKFFKKVAGNLYDKNDESSLYDRNKIYPIFRKTQKWAEHVAKKTKQFKSEGRKTWLHYGKFRSYSWYKIFKPSDEDTQVFFTVGADASGDALYIKLDCLRESVTNKDSLPEEVVHEFDQLRKERIPKKDRPKGIPIQNFSKYNWEKLISETVEYIKSYEEIYDEAVQLVREKLGFDNEKREKRISRLCWNDNGWIKPSGKYGKSKDPDSHEYKHGYGHEEWLFDFNKMYKGYQYGFLEPIRKHQQKYANQSFDVWLYTINNETKERFWVGMIKNLEVLDNEKSSEAEKEIASSSVKKEMRRQILFAGGKLNELSKWKGVNIFNVRFKKENLFFNDPLVPLEKDHPVHNYSRYTFADYPNEFKVIESELVLDEQFLKGEEQPNPEPKEIQGYERFRKIIEPKNSHYEISYKLVEVLKKKYGNENVRQNVKAGYGNNEIDIVVKEGNEFIFYEIKTYNSIRRSIREALGQILEYAFWVEREQAKELIILTEPLQGLDKAKKYVKHLRTKLNIDLYLRTFDLESKELSEKY